MEYYKYYLCVGLGTWLMAKVVDSANPNGDMGFFEEIISFLTTVLVWPISLIANYIHSLQVRKMEQIVIEEMEKLMKNLPITPPESSESDKDESDKGSA